MPYAAAPQEGTAKRPESRRYFEIAKPLAKIASKVRLPELVGRG